MANQAIKTDGQIVFTSSLVGTNFKSSSANSELNSEMSLLSMCCLMHFGEKPILLLAITKQEMLTSLLDKLAHSAGLAVRSAMHTHVVIFKEHPKLSKIAKFGCEMF